MALSPPLRDTVPATAPVGRAGSNATSSPTAARTAMNLPLIFTGFPPLSLMLQHRVLLVIASLPRVSPRRSLATGAWPRDLLC